MHITVKTAHSPTVNCFWVIVLSAFDHLISISKEHLSPFYIQLLQFNNSPLQMSSLSTSRCYKFSQKGEKSLYFKVLSKFCLKQIAQHLTQGQGYETYRTNGPGFGSSQTTFKISSNLLLTVKRRYLCMHSSML